MFSVNVARVGFFIYVLNEHDLVDKTLFEEVNGHDEGACTSTIYFATQDFIARFYGSIQIVVAVDVWIKIIQGGPRSKILSKVIWLKADLGSVISNDVGSK